MALVGLAGALLVQLVMAGTFEDGVAAYQRGDYATALKLFLLRAQKGDAHAQYNVGAMYEFGIGMPFDLGEVLTGVRRHRAEAIKWYKLAAGQGDVCAQATLGGFYFAPRSSVRPHDSEAVEAVKWHRMAADQNYASSQFYLGRLADFGYETATAGAPRVGNFVQAYIWYSLSNANGDPRGAMTRDALLWPPWLARIAPNQVAEAQRLVQDWQLVHAKRSPLCPWDVPSWRVNWLELIDRAP